MAAWHTAGTYLHNTLVKSRHYKQPCLVLVTSPAPGSTILRHSRDKLAGELVAHLLHLQDLLRALRGERRGPSLNMLDQLVIAFGILR
tara:strand:+ start:29 stop:292 length:264 start_codon:yes stop_codon:yes gene_type:complete